MFILTTEKHWMEWSTEYPTLPYVVKIPLGNTEVQHWLSMWENASTTTFLLESGKAGRYTYVGNRPRSIIYGKGLQAKCIDNCLAEVASPNIRSVRGQPLDVVKTWMNPYRTPVVEGTPHFIGGCVGFWSYDIVRTLEKIPVIANDDLDIPEYSFAQYDEIWVIDHLDHALYIAIHVHPEPHQSETSFALANLYAHTKTRAHEMIQTWFKQIHNQQTKSKINPIDQAELPFDIETIQNWNADFSKEAYLSAVNKIQAYIRQGDVFQVNLAIRQKQKLISSPEHIYEALRHVNPSPYMGLLRFDKFSIVSGSPELLVQCIQGKLRTRPIAGTRPRGITASEDRRLAQELIHNEKERAEHVMLVDLGRNDLGKISVYGTVHVKDFMVVEPYSHVMHIVSEINGELAQGKDAFDVIRATFPGGTITGAPKVRTMEIIEELEPVRRGPYTGSMGWIDYNGNMEFNIIIRSLLCSEGIGYVQAGAGIVIDSEPEKEYIESLNKSKAIWKAIEYSQKQMSKV